MAPIDPVTATALAVAFFEHHRRSESRYQAALERIADLEEKSNQANNREDLEGLLERLEELEREYLPEGEGGEGPEQVKAAQILFDLREQITKQM